MLTAQRRQLARVAAAWGVVFGVFHVYWAAGGGLGMDEPVEGLAGQSYVAVVAAIGFLSTAVALGLVAPWGEQLGRVRLRRLAIAGSIALGLGVCFNALDWIIDDTQLGDDGVAGVTIWAYFLCGSVLFGLLARRAAPCGHARHTGQPSRRRSGRRPT